MLHLSLCLSMEESKSTGHTGKAKFGLHNLPFQFRVGAMGLGVGLGCGGGIGFGSTLDLRGIPGKFSEGALELLDILSEVQPN